MPKRYATPWLPQRAEPWRFFVNVDVPLHIHEVGFEDDSFERLAVVLKGELTSDGLRILDYGVNELGVVRIALDVEGLGNSLVLARRLSLARCQRHAEFVLESGPQ